MASVDGKKASLFFCGLALHIHILTIAFNGYQLEEGTPADLSPTQNTCSPSHSDAVKAFLIIAYLLYIIAFLIDVLNHLDVPLTSNHNLLRLVLTIDLLLAAASMVIGVAITGYCTADAEGKVSVPFTVTTYTLAAASAVVSVAFRFFA